MTDGKAIRGISGSRTRGLVVGWRWNRWRGRDVLTDDVGMQKCLGFGGGETDSFRRWEVLGWLQLGFRVCFVRKSQAA